MKGLLAVVLLSLSTITFGASGSVLGLNTFRMDRMPQAAVDDKAHNEIGFDQDIAYVSDLKAYWGYSSLHYYRLLNPGKIGARMNAAFRFGTSGKQYQVEYNPKITDKLTLDVVLGYANQTQFLFPNLQYRVDAYITLPENLELALGQGTSKFIRFNNQKLLLYTVSLGKYIGNYFIWFRPSYYTPKHTTYNELSLRRYFSDAMNYVTITAGVGRLTDIGDLPPYDRMLTLRQKALGVNGQIGVRKNVFLKAGLGYAQQNYQTGLNRDVTDGYLNLIFQF